MVELCTRLHVARLHGGEVFAFLIRPNDRDYQRWWPGTHLELHATDEPNGVYMDEFVGPYRLRMTAVVTEAVPGRLIVWQLKKWIRLPVRLVLELEDDEAGVTITHTVRAGWSGPGRLLDRFFRLFLAGGFARALDQHVKAEFPKLRDLLRGREASAQATGSLSSSR